VGVEELVFPVLGLTSRGSLLVKPTVEHLTLNTAAGLKGGYYEGFRLVDSRGKWFRVRSARKLHGVGPFGGYNFFLNRRIRVGLELEDEGRQADVAELKELVLREFREWHGWSSRGDFAALRERVEVATTVTELLNILVKAVTHR
jgi:hypothetical protein